MWRQILPAAFLLTALITSAQSVAGEQIATLQAEARERGLADTREWQDLLHFRKRRFLPGRRSGTRDPGFFNASDGWRNPQAELDATLAAFFQPLDAVADDEQHPQCRFIARYHWLLERLSMDSQSLPQADCQRYQEWRDAIDPNEITLVFAAAYVNNPASMFGHTLLRIDPEGQSPDGRLLSYVINHAAATNESSGLVFAVRGLSGGYPGLFSIMPYYEKVREYSSLENRDLWEYRLALTPTEVERLLMHTWEVSDTAFPYYFLHQNCSYRLLGLLDVARPGMFLSDRFGWYAIPTDTVRATLDQQGLLSEVVYRPAQRTLLDQRIERLDETERALIFALALDDLDVASQVMADLSTARQAELLEAAYDYLHFRYSRGEVDAQERLRMRDLLLARSRLGPRADTVDIQTPAIRPEQGHGTLRLGAGGGRRGGADFLSLHWRPAYHDFLDPPAGYIPGAHIAYGDLELRYDLERDEARLERLMLVDIESIAPRDLFFRHWSWRIRAGVEQRLRLEGDRSLMAGVAGGGGYAWELPSMPVTGMVGIQAEGWVSERLEDKARAGAGPRLDLFWGGELFRWTATATALAYTDHASPAWRLGLWQSSAMGRHASVRVGLSREQDFSKTETSLQVQLHGYF